MSLLACLFVAGCGARGNAELLEGRLRAQEDALRELESRLATTESELRLAREEAVALRRQLLEQEQQPIATETLRAHNRAVGIRFSKLMTGSVDRDGIPGDDLLHVVFYPHDLNGELVKVPGAIELELFDLSQTDADRRIGVWRFDESESYEYWHRGLFNSGYLFRLQWQEAPRSSELVLHARLTMSDGRVFEASQHVEIRPPSASPSPDGASPAGPRMVKEPARISRPTQASPTRG